jgi:hypothetical protein
VALLLFTNFDHLTFDPQNVRLEAKKKLPNKKLAGKSSLRANQTKGKRFRLRDDFGPFYLAKSKPNFCSPRFPTILIIAINDLP